MKLFLTSAGFDNENLIGPFLTLLGKPGKSAKALFIPTALNSPRSREYIPLFLEDLYKLGIWEDNITFYDLDEEMTPETLDAYDLVFVCPGDPEYLLHKMRETGFLPVLLEALEKDMPYIGLSAGCDILAANLPDSPELVEFMIECHAMDGSPDGPVEPGCDAVYLTDRQALIVDGERMEIIS